MPPILYLLKPKIKTPQKRGVYIFDYLLYVAVFGSRGLI